MATILEFDRVFVVEEKVANYLVKRGVLFKCGGTHDGMIEADLPAFHLTVASANIGRNGLQGRIREAKKIVGS